MLLFTYYIVRKYEISDAVCKVDILNGEIIDFI